jgi:hypothetical protein
VQSSADRSRARASGDAANDVGRMRVPGRVDSQRTTAGTAGLDRCCRESDTPRHFIRWSSSLAEWRRTYQRSQSAPPQASSCCDSAANRATSSERPTASLRETPIASPLSSASASRRAVSPHPQLLVMDSSTAVRSIPRDRQNRCAQPRSPGPGCRQRQGTQHRSGPDRGFSPGSPAEQGQARKTWLLMIGGQPAAPADGPAGGEERGAAASTGRDLLSVWRGLRLSGERAGLDAEDSRGEHELVVVPGLLVHRAHKGSRVDDKRCVDLPGLVCERCLARLEHVSPGPAACRRLT